MSLLPRTPRLCWERLRWGMYEMEARAPPRRRALSRIFRSAHPVCRVSCVCFRPCVFNKFSHFFSLLAKKTQGAGTWILVDAPRARPARGIVRGPDSPERKMKRIPPSSLFATSTHKKKIENKINEYG